jgi:proteasome lid subunit RPN8/RPN11
MGSLPDSRELWDVIWKHRERLAGVAHSHPGGGVPGPSHEDVTTFSAVELALGRRLDWWITSADAVVVGRWEGPHKYDYRAERVEPEPAWTERLRSL